MWQFISLADYRRTLESAPEPEKKIIHYLWSYYFGNNKKASISEDEIELDDPDLRMAPTRLLDRIAPAPAWTIKCSEVDPNAAHLAEEESDRTASEQITLSLSHTLAGWLHNHSGGGSYVHAIVSAPYSDVPAMVEGWALQNQLMIYPLPTVEQVRQGGSDWFERLQVQLASISDQDVHKVRLVLIGLEKCYFRHHGGLAFIRRLVEFLTIANSPSLLVCDSWAWSYLKSALHIDATVRGVHTLARCKREDLAGWLIDLSLGSEYHTLTFRQGKDVLFTVGTDVEIECNEALSNTFFERLVTESRGNPGLARALWRRSLRVQADVNIQEKIQQQAEDDPGVTIWVRPFKNLELPQVPTTFTNDDAFILHSLLLHGGLSQSILNETLPLSTSRLSRRLQVMRNLELIQIEQDEIRVSPYGYGSVRNYLRGQGFLTDDL